MKVGIYPGAFDPVHSGHIAFAKAAMEQHGLDKVFLLPEPKPRHRQGVKALEHRVAMARTAARSQPGLGVIVLEQMRFTVEATWPLLQARFKGAELFMLMGSDAANRLVSWPHIHELVRSSPTFLIANRGVDEAALHDMITVLHQTTRLPISYSVLTSNYPTYSSLRIRQTLKRGGIPRALDSGVLEYIQENQLYTSGAV